MTAAVAAKGWLAAHKWLLLRRLSQALFLGLFLAGPLAGWWIVEGTLASSVTLGVLPLTDPLLALQSLAAGHVPEAAALTGAVLVAVTYALIGGRVFCSWVCPVNPLTDLAHWLRARLGIQGNLPLARSSRLWLLAGVLLAAAVTGRIAWETVNPVTLLHRALVFGTFTLGGAAFTATAAVFLLDLLVARGWCGRLCPVGAFYGLLGHGALIRVAAPRRADCDDCLDCYRVCPEPHVLAPVLRGRDKGTRPVVLSHDCTNCGRCIDVCAREVFTVGTRFSKDEKPATGIGE